MDARINRCKNRCIGRCIVFSVDDVLHHEVNAVLVAGLPILSVRGQLVQLSTSVLPHFGQDLFKSVREDWKPQEDVEIVIATRSKKNARSHLAVEGMCSLEGRSTIVRRMGEHWWPLSAVPTFLQWTAMGTFHDILLGFRAICPHPPPEEHTAEAKSAEAPLVARSGQAHVVETLRSSGIRIRGG